MYDAKNEPIKEDLLKFDCIADKCYFNQITANTLFNLKSGYIPIENDLNMPK
jgi:hypothetical protein